jgi:hypothetical protein
MTFRERLRAAVEAGLLLGVKILIVLAVLLLGAGWLIGDYNITRARAAHGQEIWELVQKQQQAQQGKQP